MITAGLIKQMADQAGFLACGITHPVLLNNHRQSLLDWIQSGHHAGMDYMERHADLREDIRLLFPPIRSVVVVLWNYLTETSSDPRTNLGKISRYASGPDYHFTMREKLDWMASRLIETDSGLEYRIAIDSAPVFEREYARLAGLGWIGKHSLLLSKQGSWFNIGLLLLNRDLEADQPYQTNHCGTCNACMSACPTQAIIKPGTIDSNRCISYQTIENKQETLPDGFDTNGWIWGCDICQEVCPWNQKFGNQLMSPDQPGEGIWKTMDLQHIENLSSSRFRKTFSQTPMIRRGKKGFLRNIIHTRKQ